MINKVSVIIPVFNAQEYINETINSVIKQTYEGPIEIIIIDDHSTDNSFQIVREFESDSIIVKKNPKKGACAARNYGFELSTGDYIQYLDADDLLSENKIEQQLKLAKLYGPYYVYSCGHIRFNKNIDEQIWQNRYVDKDYENPKLWLLDCWMGKGVGAIHSWLISRDLVNLAGPWDEKLTLNQDGEFISRVLLNAHGIKFSERARVYYRSGITNSISQNDKFGKEKAQSLLNSYISYKESSIMHNSLESLKVGIGHNFLMFIYQYFGRFPDLTDLATKEFYSLGFDKMWPVGGDNFKRLVNLIGFNHALKLKRLLKF